MIHIISLEGVEAESKLCQAGACRNFKLAPREDQLFTLTLGVKRPFTPSRHVGRTPCIPLNSGVRLLNKPMTIFSNHPGSIELDIPQGFDGFLQYAMTP